MLSETMGAWALGELAKATVAAAARTLLEHGITIMPMKGVELIARYGADASKRHLSDADVLAPSKMGASDAHARRWRHPVFANHVPVGRRLVLRGPGGIC